jgi:hypothetical protein
MNCKTCDHFAYSGHNTEDWPVYTGRCTYNSLIFKAKTVYVEDYCEYYKKGV